MSEIGAKLRVSTVLEGSVRQAGSHLRITAQLINVADGFQVWSARYDREMVDVFAIQDEIARAIAKELELKLTGTSAEPLVRRGTDNLEAYDLYLKGRFFWSRRGPWLNKAKECFDQAVAADPSFALAQAGVADCQCILALYGYISSRGAFERARAVTALALALDDRCSEAHQAAGLFELTMGWDLARGERELRRAAELNPSSAAAWAWLGILLSVVGRHTESLEAIRRAYRSNRCRRWSTRLRRWAFSCNAPGPMPRRPRIARLSLIRLQRRALSCSDLSTTRKETLPTQSPRWNAQAS